VTETNNFKLIIEDDEGRRNVVPVDIGDVSIGRLDGNTVRLNERNVSRRHARLSRDNASVIAEDLDSYNGVWINGNRIKGRQPLHDGDLLRIGDFQLELRGEGLHTRTDETTQRTPMVDTEATQPEIRLGRSTEPLEQVTEEPEPREEPTALIRMAHLEEVETSRREKSAIAGQRAKLVCVSTEYAGQEFEIGKTEMVIGRTEDNDIGIDHRSVSRHHAKVVTNGRSVKIVDLKSANGTLVNGEEYAQADLRNGDLVELGHVKLRFVPPGESYSLTAEEQKSLQHDRLQSVPTANEGNRSELAHRSRANPLLMALVATLTLVVLVMVAYLLFEDSGSRPTTQADATLTPPPTVEVPKDGASEAERLASQAANALSQRQWDKAATMARAALAHEAEHAAAREVLSKSEIEVAAQASYDQGVASINESNMPQAWNHLQVVPPTSVYYPQARSLMGQVKGTLITSRIQGAEEALEAGEWSKAETLATEIESLDMSAPEVAQIREDAEEGRHPKRVKPTVRVPKPPKPPVATVVSPSSPPPVDSGPDAKTLYKEGTAALKVSQFQKALDKFNACVKADKRFCPCHRALGITYARASSGPKAYRYYKQYLKVCPNAEDGPQVEKLLKQYEESQ